MVGAVGFLSRTFDKSLSIREHEEYRNATKAQLDEIRNAMLRLLADIKSDFRREADRLEDRIKTIEQTRPTTGEIEARMDKDKL